MMFLCSAVYFGYQQHHVGSEWLVFHVCQGQHGADGGRGEIGDAGPKVTSQV